MDERTETDPDLLPPVEVPLPFLLAILVPVIAVLAFFLLRFSRPREVIVRRDEDEE